MKHTYRILVADDDQLSRWAAKTRLAQNKRFVIEEAETAEDALKKVSTGSFDVVLMDIGFPGMDGVAALEDLMSRPSCPKVIMLTAEDRDEVTLRCLARGAFDYLCKPVDLDVIETAVMHALALTTREDSEPVEEDDYLGLFVGISDDCQQIRNQVRRITASKASTVLIQGESGVGKEIIARAIHVGSQSAGPYMTVNVTAVPSGLLESELFGHEVGAFTDAKHTKKGLFELADGGTLLLDEIGDMDLPLQGKLLRVLEERTFKRVGGTSDISVQLRVVATTNVDLAKAVEAGMFRRDLYYRLNVIPIHVPPLRERPEDIPLLVRHFVRLLNEQLSASVKFVSAGAMALLCKYPWPGNARQLRNVIERCLVVEVGDTILANHLPREIRDGLGNGQMDLGGTPPMSVPELPEDGLDLEDVERELIRQALEQTNGNITQAGKLVGLHRDTLRYRARKYGLI